MRVAVAARERQADGLESVHASPTTKPSIDSWAKVTLIYQFTSLFSLKVISHWFKGKLWLKIVSKSVWPTSFCTT